MGHAVHLPWTVYVFDLEALTSFPQSTTLAWWTLWRTTSGTRSSTSTATLTDSSDSKGSTSPSPGQDKLSLSPIGTSFKFHFLFQQVRGGVRLPSWVGEEDRIWRRCKGTHRWITIWHLILPFIEDGLMMRDMMWNCNCFRLFHFKSEGIYPE